MVKFRPWRSAIAMFALVALPLAYRFDWGLGGPEALTAALPDAWAFLDGYPRELISRILTSWFKLLLALGALAALLFGILQIVVSRLDVSLARSERENIRFLGRIMRALTGRFGVKDRREYITLMAERGSDLTLAPLRLGIAAFPMLGFLGTVVGLSSTIEKLPAALRDKDEALQGVLDSLNIAFDTTFLGLLGALFCLLCLRIAETLQDDAVAQV